jgi:HSP20 family protein
MALLMKPEPFTTEFDRLFNQLFDRNEAARRWVPAMDLVEGDDHFTLRADLPGMTEADVNIEVRDNTLTLSGERKTEHEDRQRGYYRLERQFGKFSRALSLPEGVNPDAIDAKFDHGVLEVVIPKPEERKPRRIEIKAGVNGNGNGKPQTLEGSATER